MHKWKQKERVLQLGQDPSVTYGDHSFSEAEGAPTAVLGLVLRLVVAKRVVFQHHPTVLPSMDVVCPLEKEKHFITIFVY